MGIRILLRETFRSGKVFSVLSVDWKSLSAWCLWSSFATPLSSLHRSLAVMLLLFEVCEVCCVCHCHANPGDNPSHLFPETSVHGPRLYSSTIQFTRSTLILKRLEDGKESIFRGSLVMLVQTLCSLMNIQYVSKLVQAWNRNLSHITQSRLTRCLCWENVKSPSWTYSFSHTIITPFFNVISFRMIFALMHSNYSLHCPIVVHFKAKLWILWRQILSKY